MSESPLEGFAKELQIEHKFSEGSISFLKKKGFQEEDFQRLYDAMILPDQTFAKWRESRSPLEELIERGDAKEITEGRYEDYVTDFSDISSEQALVKGRLKFAIEYDIALADLLGNPKNKLVERPFSDEEKLKLRSIYENFRTKDYVAVKIIEDKTDHDIVAANAWATIRAQQEELDGDLMERITHFVRTSDDDNANVIGELYMKALGCWTKSISNLLIKLEERAGEYADVCVARTHGQKAQLTTMGHIFANLGEEIRQYANTLLKEEQFRLEGKIAGAIGTDVDMTVCYPDIDPANMYRHIVEDMFGLKFVNLGIDQSCTNAAFAQALDTISNVNLVIKKAATDTWLYASRGIIAKKTKKGQSGSSIMTQKANPFRAESAEALVSMANSMMVPIKEAVIAYREQGDLRRSVIMREAFHPLMLSIIATERLIGELKNYGPDIIEIQKEIYADGPKIISSCINNILRAEGVSYAYDDIKDLVMKPRVNPEEIKIYLNELVENKKINTALAEKLEGWLYSVIDTKGLINKLYDSPDADTQKSAIEKLRELNRDKVLQELIGTAVPQTYEMIENSKETRRLLSRYSN